MGCNGTKAVNAALKDKVTSCRHYPRNPKSVDTALRDWRNLRQHCRDDLPPPAKVYKERTWKQDVFCYLRDHAANGSVLIFGSHDNSTLEMTPTDVHLSGHIVGHENVP